MVESALSAPHTQTLQETPLPVPLANAQMQAQTLQTLPGFGSKQPNLLSCALLLFEPEQMCCYSSSSLVTGHTGCSKQNRPGRNAYTDIPRYTLIIFELPCFKHWTSRGPQLRRVDICTGRHLWMHTTKRTAASACHTWLHVNTHTQCKHTTSMGHPVTRLCVKQCKPHYLLCIIHALYACV